MLWAAACFLFLFGAVYGVNILIEALELARLFHPYGADRRWVFGKIAMGAAIFIASAGGIAMTVWLHELTLK